MISARATATNSERTVTQHGRDRYTHGISWTAHKALAIIVRVHHYTDILATTDQPIGQAIPLGGPFPVGYTQTSKLNKSELWSVCAAVVHLLSKRRVNLDINLWTFNYVSSLYYMLRFNVSSKADNRHMTSE